MLGSLERVYKFIQSVPPEMKRLATATAVIGFAAYGSLRYTQEKFALEMKNSRDEQLLLKMRMMELEREVNKFQAKIEVYDSIFEKYKKIETTNPPPKKDPPSTPAPNKTILGNQQFFKELSGCKGLEECSAIFKRYANCEGGTCSVAISETLCPQPKPVPGKDEEKDLDGVKISEKQEESAPEVDKE